MQKFKGDATENKYIGSVQPVLDALSDQKDLFDANAYFTGPLGDILWTQNRAPLSQTIKQDVFRDIFQVVFEEFRYAGTFDSYLSIFDQIFGPQCEVEFIVPAPGKLEMSIVVQGFSIDDIVDDDGDSIITQDGVNHVVTKNQNAVNSEFAVVRQLIAGAEVQYDLVTEDGDNIMFQVVKGFKTQYELEQMLFEFVPAGIFTTVTLTI